MHTLQLLHSSIDYIPVYLRVLYAQGAPVIIVPLDKIMPGASFMSLYWYVIHHASCFIPGTRHLSPTRAELAQTCPRRHDPYLCPHSDLLVVFPSTTIPQHSAAHHGTAKARTPLVRVRAGVSVAGRSGGHRSPKPRIVSPSAEKNRIISSKPLLIT